MTVRVGQNALDGHKVSVDKFNKIVGLITSLITEAKELRELTRRKRPKLEGPHKTGELRYLNPGGTASSRVGRKET